MELTEFVPEWIKIIKHSILGNLVKIDTSSNIRDIINKVEVCLKNKESKINTMD